MPLVRIDIRKGKDSTYRREIGRVVYEALIGVGVPKNDRFQVISEHEDDKFLFDPDYIGVHRSDDLVASYRRAFVVSVACCASVSHMTTLAA